MSPYKLKELIRHYSEFVTHPVSLRQIKTIQVPKEKEEVEEADVTEDESKKDEEKDDIVFGGILSVVARRCLLTDRALILESAKECR